MSFSAHSINIETLVREAFGRDPTDKNRPLTRRLEIVSAKRAPTAMASPHDRPTPIG